MQNIKNILARWLCGLGLTANGATLLGLFFAALSGYFIYQGHFLYGAGALLLSGILDLLDGAIARHLKSSNYFGGILDSTLDRYGDGFVLSGILFYFAQRGEYLYSALSMSALLGSFLVSYVRARAECEIDKCKVGLWERGERIVYIFLGLLLNNMEVVLWILAIATHLTALFRLYFSAQDESSRSIILEDRSYPKKILLHTGTRNDGFYYAKAFLLALSLILVRLPK